jgi:hypothetical protein
MEAKYSKQNSLAFCICHNICMLEQMIDAVYHAAGIEVVTKNSPLLFGVEIK